MTTNLIQVHTTIEVIREWRKKHKITQQTFVDATIGSDEDKDRAAICMKVVSVAENLKQALKNDPAISSMYSNLPQTVSEIRGIRNIIAHEYGVTDGVDYNQIWSLITGILEELYQTIEDTMRSKEGMKRTAPFDNMEGRDVKRTRL